MKNKKLLEGLEKDSKTLIEAYLDDGGCDNPGGAIPRILTWEKWKLADNLAALERWDAEARLCVKFLFGRAESSGDYSFFRRFTTANEEGLMAVMDELVHPPDWKKLADEILYSRDFDPTPAANPTSERPFRSARSNIAWTHGDFRTQTPHGRSFLPALLAFRPEVLSSWIRAWDAAQDRPFAEWLEIFAKTDRFDEEIVDALIGVIEMPMDQHGNLGYAKRDAFAAMVKIDALREGRFREKLLKWAADPKAPAGEEVIDVLVRECPKDALRMVMAKEVNRAEGSRRALFPLAIHDLDGQGGLLFQGIITSGYLGCDAEAAIEILLTKTPEGSIGRVMELLRKGAEGRNNVEGRSSAGLPGYWREVAKYLASWLAPEMRNLLTGTNRAVREIAAGWMAANETDPLAFAKSLLNSSKIPERVGGVHLLAAVGGEPCINDLREWHDRESSKAVRELIAEILAKHGIAVAPEPEKEVEGIADFTEFEKRLAAKPKAIKPPKAPWLSPGKLPPLFTKDGSPLSELALTFLLQRQAREKGEVNEEVVPMLAHLDRAKNAPFAHALLDQWFASDMKATTRWALDVAGITGDDSIIRRLTEPMEHWCMGNNGSRAEWAAHAIALLGSEKALGTLDGMIQRFRTRRKYVGAAAALAIFRTAEMMGISADELAERIVPDFGFNADGEKDLPLKKGSCTAVLCDDFKIAFRDGEKLLANPPAKLPEESEEELKETRKFLREAVSRQTLRLQDSMIGGKRWPLDVWRGRYEAHPLFRIFAMRLVWGVYGEDGKLLRTFRLYPNGLTADAAGGLEEFPEPAAKIGIVHRMELDDKTAKDWAAHLKRFRVKPLFKQLDRPVHALDPGHGNRREIKLTQGLKTTAGTLRKELLGRGWSLSAAGDGGSLSGMWRRFPGSDIEAYLPACDLHAMSSAGETVELEAAIFAHGNPAKNNYRDFPSEAAAVTFGNVPPIIYSETIADLQGITPPP
jgi:Domain of unknown function (DUF4132)